MTLLPRVDLLYYPFSILPWQAYCPEHMFCVNSAADACRLAHTASCRFVQIVLALYHVHSKNILHRDLKSQNIFISEGGQSLPPCNAEGKGRVLLEFACLTFLTAVSQQGFLDNQLPMGSFLVHWYECCCPYFYITSCT